MQEKCSLCHGSDDNKLTQEGQGLEGHANQKGQFLVANPRADWEKTVKGMQTSHHAPLSDKEAAEIVTFLDAEYGKD